MTIACCAAAVHTAAMALVSALLDQKDVKPGKFLELHPDIVLAAVNLTFSYDVILYREAYKELIDQIDQQRREFPLPSTFIEVTGTPGIGKSTMIIFLLRHLFLQGKKVVHMLSRAAVTYTPFETRQDDGSVRIRYEVLVVPANEMTDYSADAYVTDLKEPPVLALPNLYFWTHSPGSKTTSILTDAHVYTLPVWSYDELKLLNECLQQKHQDEKGVPEFPALSDEDLNENFARWGGVPRHVMKLPAHSENLLQRAFNKLRGSSSGDIDVLRRATTTYLESERLLDRLLLIAVDKNFKPSARYWSKRTGEFMMQAFRDNIHYLQQQFATLFEGAPDAHGTFGKLFEPFCHGLFSLGKSVTLQLKHLPRPEVKRHDGTVEEPPEQKQDPREVHFDAGSISVVWFNTQKKLAETAMQPGRYYRPTYETMRSGDAFLLIRYVDDENVTHNVLYIFQITVSPRHPVIGQGILDIIGLFSTTPTLEVCLVFLVPTVVSEGFRRQSYHKVGEKKVLHWKNQQKALRSVKQYVAGIEYALPLPEVDTNEVIDEDDYMVGEPSEELIGEDDEGAAGTPAAEMKNEV